MFRELTKPDSPSRNRCPSEKLPLGPKTHLCRLSVPELEAFFALTRLGCRAIMLWLIVLLLLSPLVAVMGRLMPADREIIALRQRVPIPQPQLGKRPRSVGSGLSAPAKPPERVPANKAGNHAPATPVGSVH